MYSRVPVPIFLAVPLATWHFHFSSLNWIEISKIKYISISLLTTPTSQLISVENLKYFCDFKDYKNWPLQFLDLISFCLSLAIFCWFYEHFPNGSFWFYSVPWPWIIYLLIFNNTLFYSGNFSHDMNYKKASSSIPIRLSLSWMYTCLRVMVLKFLFS